MSSEKISKHWLLFDGKCGMCRRTVKWIGRRDRRGLFEIVEFQNAPSPPITPQLYDACHKAMHVVKSNGEILRAGRAMLFVLNGINWTNGFLPAFLSLPPMIWFVEIGYKLIAANRTFFSRFIFVRGENGQREPFCELPSKEKSAVNQPPTKAQKR